MAQATQSKHSSLAVVEVAPHIIGPEHLFEGMVKHAGHVEVRGVVRGKVVAPTISVRRGGRIEGHAESQHIRNDGVIEGTVRAGRLELSKRSVLGGDVQFGTIGVEPGCQILPRTTMMTLSPEMIPDVSPEAVARDISSPRRQRQIVRPQVVVHQVEAETSPHQLQAQQQIQAAQPPLAPYVAPGTQALQPVRMMVQAAVADAVLAGRLPAPPEQAEADPQEADEAEAEVRRPYLVMLGT